VFSSLFERCLERWGALPSFVTAPVMESEYHPPKDS
jgi:hypothetical protein